MNTLRLFNTDILKHYPKALTVAIVGNAGISKVDDFKIAQSDIVIRFNNYATREGITHTAHKFRCDILFSTLDLHSVGAKPKDVVIGIPYPFKAREIAKKIETWYPNSRHWMVDPYENLKLCDELGLKSDGYKHPLPSVGLTALYHMRNLPFNFYICGFSWYWDLKTQLFQGHHLSNPIMKSHWNHAYPLEIKWIIDNLLPKNNIIFSKECRKLLSIAQDQFNVQA